MSPKDGDLGVLRRLAAMPFMDRLEMAAISRAADRTIYRATAGVERRGLVSSFSHATELLPSVKRYCLTVAGVSRLAELEDTGIDRLLRSRPLSAQWRRVLLERLDAVAVIYRLASSIAVREGPLWLRWFRAAPLDATMVIPGGRTVGVLRQGPTADRTGFSKRLWRLSQGPLPGIVLILMPDEVRLRHALGMSATRSLPALLAIERDAAWAAPSDAVWRMPSVAAALDLSQVLSHVDGGGSLFEEPEPLRATLLPDITVAHTRKKKPHWMLPTMLKPAEKRLAGLLFDWPGISAEDLRRLMGISRARLYLLLGSLTELDLVRHVPTAGRRLALTDQGLAMLARRDRTSVGVQKKRWSVEPVEPDAPDTWRNIRGRRSRQLLRNLEHTTAVHGFLSALAMQARKMGWSLEQLDPPFRASRYFPHGFLSPRLGGMRSIHPDAFGLLRRDGVNWPFFLEWEKRAVRPVTMVARLAPYLRYYSSRRPADDHGAQPVLLVVFHEELVATHFLGVARERMARTGTKVPLWVSHRSIVDELGPFGRVWRKPGLWESVCVLPEC